MAATIAPFLLAIATLCLGSANAWENVFHHSGPSCMALQFLAVRVGFGEVNVLGRGNGTTQPVQFAARVVGPNPIQNPFNTAAFRWNATDGRVVADFTSLPVSVVQLNATLPPQCVAVDVEAIMPATSVVNVTVDVFPSPSGDIPALNHVNISTSGTCVVATMSLSAIHATCDKGFSVANTTACGLYAKSTSTTATSTLNNVTSFSMIAEQLAPVVVSSRGDLRVPAVEVVGSQVSMATTTGDLMLSQANVTCVACNFSTAAGKLVFDRTNVFMPDLSRTPVVAARQLQSRGDKRWARLAKDAHDAALAPSFAISAPPGQLNVTGLSVATYGS